MKKEYTQVQREILMIALSDLYKAMHGSQIYAYNGLVHASLNKYNCPYALLSAKHFFEDSEIDDVLKQLDNLNSTIANLNNYKEKDLEKIKNAR